MVRYEFVFSALGSEALILGKWARRHLAYEPRRFVDLPYFRFDNVPLNRDSACRVVNEVGVRKSVGLRNGPDQSVTGSLIVALASRAPFLPGSCDSSVAVRAQRQHGNGDSCGAFDEGVRGILQDFGGAGPDGPNLQECRGH